MKLLFRSLLIIFLLININACNIHKIIAKKNDIPEHNFNINLTGDRPNYSDLKYWIEHPKKKSITQFYHKTIQILTTTIIRK